MKLSKFPYLVQQEVLSNMASSHLFLLSFVSKNMKALIKSSQVARFKNVIHIKYNCMETNQPDVEVFYRDAWDPIVKIAEEGTRTDGFQLTVSGKLIDFRIFYLILWSSKMIQMILKKLISGYRFMYGPFPEEKMSKMFGRDARADHIKFSPESEFYQAESMKVDQYEHTIPAVLQHFQGRQAFIRCRYCKISDLIGFVNEWKTGKGFQRLEYLEIRIRSFDEGLPQNEILDGIGAKYIAQRNHHQRMFCRKFTLIIPILNRIQTESSATHTSLEKQMVMWRLFGFLGKLYGLEYGTKQSSSF
ncbi:Protein CBG12276 [Caenorhabditis briggsae]|uniref:Protein CBG12276 n=1 Tax=Caenorhabditis briggsae TaxID=6238 RepID=A8XF57_CAEBR|nr:Protein CBG12276 [Caenorhabditis briggsae]CAP31279.1 Protein CBG12276 [Caenorhabditis briggsae]